MQVAAEKYVSLQEYLAAEEVSQEKHEYWAGRVYPVDGGPAAMAGGTPRHADLIGNVTAAFVTRLRGKRCRGSCSEQRIRVEQSDVEFYPDFVVKSPPERYSEKDPNALVNPILVVEVLSPASEKYDRGEKFQQYSLIPELTEYLLVSQDRILVERFTRGTNGEWILRRFTTFDANISLPDLEIEVPLAEIYEGLDLPSGLMTLRTSPSPQ